MDIITVDFETYYDKQFSLSKLTTEEYIRNTKFEVIGVAVKVNGGETIWLSGEIDELRTYLHDNFSWETSALLAHNTMFDGAILNWVFDIRPKLYLDTLCMGRAVNGTEVSSSLATLSQKYNLGEKGDEVVSALGKHRLDFGDDDLSKYGDYCVNDVDLTYALFSKLVRTNNLKTSELKVIDLTLRMFIHPVLTLNTQKLKDHLDTIKGEKDKLIQRVNISKDDLMSNPKFAKALEELGVEAPTKISLRTGKETFALAKNDEGFVALQEHEDVRVRELVAARIGLKSTLEETRTERFLDIASRGALPVPIKYYAAHTGRWGGSDKINLQNLPSRGENAKVLKSCIEAPTGHTLVEADSAQIEARMLAWLSKQNDLLAAFEDGRDVYKIMAAEIYDKSEDEVTSEERFIGKQTVLGCGYGMGAVKFRAQLKSFGVEVDADEATRIIRKYRTASGAITALWRNAQDMLTNMYNGDVTSFGREGVLTVQPDVFGIKLPSGLFMFYDGLKATEGEKGVQFAYKTRTGYTNIYGGKVVENVCQALARCVMADQMVQISKQYRVLLTVHDSVICCVPDKQVDEAAAFVDECMSWTPEWAEGLPVRGDVEVGKNYGESVVWTPNPRGHSVA